MTKFFSRVVIGAFGTVVVKEIHNKGLNPLDEIHIFTCIKPLKGGGFKREHTLRVDSPSEEKCKIGGLAHLDCIPKDKKNPQLHKVTLRFKSLDR